MRHLGDPGPRETRVRWAFGGAVVVWMILMVLFGGRPVWVWWMTLVVIALVGWYSIKLAAEDDREE